MRLDSVTELLGIANYRVAYMVHHSDKRIDLVLDRIEEKPSVCSGCGKIHHTPVHSIDTVIIEDLPMSGKRVFLHVPKRRSLCHEDERIRTEELEWMRGRVTRRFAEHIYRLTSIATNKETGWFLGLDDEKVYRIDKSMLEELSLQRLEKVTAPRHISVDEVAWQKWHKYVTNVIDIDNRKIIWNHEGRGKTVLDKFYRKIGKKGCSKIKAVASDGARGFLSSTKEHLKSALIVLDHFHVKKYLNDALDTVRKEELRKARQQENEELSAILHCNKRFILMQNTVTDKKTDILKKLESLNKRVYQSMLLKEQFLAVYTADNRKDAYTNLRAWIMAAMNLPAAETAGYRKTKPVITYILNNFSCPVRRSTSDLSKC